MSEQSEWSDRLTDDAIDRHAVKFFRSSASQQAGIRSFAKSLWDAAIDYNIAQDSPSAGEALASIKLRIDNRNQSVSDQAEWKALRSLIVKLSNRAAPASNEAKIDALEEALEAYEVAIDEAEAIFGGEYADHYGPMFEKAIAARDARRAALSSHTEQEGGERG